MEDLEYLSHQTRRELNSYRVQLKNNDVDLKEVKRSLQKRSERRKRE